MFKTITVQTEKRSQMLDITSAVRDAARESGVREGVITLFVPHTSAGVTINENSGPGGQRDIIQKLNAVFPQDDDYRHSEGNSDAHVKTSLVGPSLQVIIHEGQPVLGTWQGIYFCEFDGPRTRKCHFQVLGSK